MIWRVISCFAGFLLGCFLALFGEFFPALFSMNENVVGVAEMLFVFVSGLSVTPPIVKLKLMQVFEKFLVKFGLQFKSKTREQFRYFRSEKSGSV
jgi:hypothetical protein